MSQQNNFKQDLNGMMKQDLKLAYLRMLTYLKMSSSRSATFVHEFVFHSNSSISVTQENWPVLVHGIDAILISN